MAGLERTRQQPQQSEGCVSAGGQRINAFERQPSPGKSAASFSGYSSGPPSIASAPARFMATVNLTGADWGETQNEVRPGLFPRVTGTRRMIGAVQKLRLV
jgi:hypothetical protein